MPSGGFRGSVGLDGELIRQTLTYNVALDVSRSTGDAATLLGADEATLLRAGVAPDSVERLVAFFRARGTEEVAELEVVQEDVRFMLPKDIRRELAARA